MYTSLLLIHLHEPNSTHHATGPRYSRFIVLSIVAFGPTLGKLLAIFPALYLSGGTCSLFVVRGGGILESLAKLLYSHHHPDSPPVTPAEWFLIFVCIAILVSQFFPTLNSLAPVSLVGSISAVIYLSMLWILSITYTTNHQPLPPSSTSSWPEILYRKNFRGIMDAISLIALTFRGHNLILEIQGTLPTSPQRPARKPMLKGFTASYVVIAMCVFPLAIGGYWAYGKTLGATITNGILEPLTSELFLHEHKTPSKKWILATIYIALLLHLICAFNLYAMLAFDNLERVIYVSKNNRACPRWVQSAIRSVYGGFVYFLAMAMPFIGKLGPFFGAMTLPLTLVYPCFMWIAIRKRMSSRRKWSNDMRISLGVGCFGTGLSFVLFGVALWDLVDYGLQGKANFFNPH
ncbi:OLC1v1016214C3 [Oldenlandia corymbosa var. corymbosa]|nr:OLC1v1016214C3 [Oldenlandia corymbosa var. corymbosa]